MAIESSRTVRQFQTARPTRSSAWVIVPSAALALAAGMALGHQLLPVQAASAVGATTTTVSAVGGGAAHKPAQAQGTCASTSYVGTASATHSVLGAGADGRAVHFGARDVEPGVQSSVAGPGASARETFHGRR